MNEIKVIAMDLDGTLTQHKTKLSAEYREILRKLSEKYKLLMAGAGTCTRIFEQMNRFPIDVLGNYGMQYAEYNEKTGNLDIIFDKTCPVDKESVEKRVTALREKYGFTEYRGDNVEYHASGCLTFPILGTKAIPEEKLAFDPDRKKRRKIYADVVETFSDYKVFIGGSSSFDMAPYPYDKAYALAQYCKERGIPHSAVLYIGDDYGEGGNDESVYKADFRYLEIDNYLDFAKLTKFLLD